MTTLCLFMSIQTSFIRNSVRKRLLVRLTPPKPATNHARCQTADRAKKPAGDKTPAGWYWRVLWVRSAARPKPAVG